jgi:hypothetical protein
MTWKEFNRIRRVAQMNRQCEQWATDGTCDHGFNCFFYHGHILDTINKKPCFFGRRCEKGPKECPFLHPIVHSNERDFLIQAIVVERVFEGDTDAEIVSSRLRKCDSVQATREDLGAGKFKIVPACCGRCGTPHDLTYAICGEGEAWPRYYCSEDHARIEEDDLEKKLLSMRTANSLKIYPKETPVESGAQMSRALEAVNGKKSSALNGESRERHRSSQTRVSRYRQYEHPDDYR